MDLLEQAMRANAEADKKKVDLSKKQPSSTFGVSASSNKSVTTQSGGTGYKKPTLKKEAPKAEVPNFREAKDMVGTYKGDEDIASALDKLLHAEPSKAPDLENHHPYNENIEIADKFTSDKQDGDYTRADRFRTRDRSDLSPLMALADFWTGGKSKLAQAYTPPESADSVFEKMLNLRSKEVKERNDTELEQFKALSQDRYNNQTRAIESAANMIGLIHQGQGKNQTQIDSRINDIMGRLKDHDANRQTSITINTNNNETKQAKDQADAYKAAQDLQVKREKLAYGSGGLAGVKKSAEFEDSLHRSLAQTMLPQGNLEKDDKKWSEVKQQFKNVAQKLTYSTINELGLLEQNGGNMDAALQQASEYLRGTYDPATRTFENPRINQLFQGLRTN